MSSIPRILLNWICLMKFLFFLFLQNLSSCSSNFFFLYLRNYSSCFFKIFLQISSQFFSSVFKFFFNFSSIKITKLYHEYIANWNERWRVRKLTLKAHLTQKDCGTCDENVLFDCWVLLHCTCNRQYFIRVSLKSFISNKPP